MSEQSIEPVRTPLKARERRHRPLGQRLALRFPRLFARFMRQIGRLPPTSRLRRVTLARAVEVGAAAYNRRDLDAVAVGYDAEIEYLPARSFVEGGFFEPCYHGPDGYKQYVASTAEVFGAEVYFKPVELIDLGDRMVVFATVPMRAQASGIPLTESFAYVATLKDGKITRLQEHYDYEEALTEARRIPTE